MKSSVGVAGAVLSIFASAEGVDAAETLPTLSVALYWYRKQLPEATPVSAPPVRLTAAKAPNVPQTPLVRVATARSTTARLESTPEPRSVPATTVKGTELENHGPPFRLIAWPVGPPESALIATVSLPVTPVPFVAVTCFAPGAVAPAAQV